MLDRFRTDESDTSSGVSRLAARTLGILAGEVMDKSAAVAPLKSYLAQLQQAVLAPQRAQLDDVITEMRAARISPAEIAETYVPIVARRLGDCWVQDTLDFRSVSIGSARLQSMLWHLEMFEPPTPISASLNHAKMLVVVPDGCQHTLGATVLAGQLRRRGLAVKLELEVTPQTLPDMLGTGGYAGLFISASSREPLETLTALVQTARQSKSAGPVLIGGNILEQMTDVQTITGADLATSDLNTALTYCGLEDRPGTAIPLRDVG